MTEHDAPGQVPERVVLNDARLARITDANPEWESAAERLAQDWETLRELIAYYESEWGNDMNAYPDAAYGVLSEDGVWNEMGRFYHSVKEIAETSARIVREYEG